MSIELVTVTGLERRRYLCQSKTGSTNSWTGGPLRRLRAASAARQGDSRLLRQGALTSANSLAGSGCSRALIGLSQ